MDINYKSLTKNKSNTSNIESGYSNIFEKLQNPSNTFSYFSTILDILVL